MCYQTLGKIGQIKPGDSIEGKTRLLMFNNLGPIEKIGLDFRIVDEFISFDTLREHQELIEDVYLAKTDEKNITWGTREQP